MGAAAAAVRREVGSGSPAAWAACGAAGSTPEGVLRCALSASHLDVSKQSHLPICRFDNHVAFDPSCLTT